MADSSIDSSLACLLQRLAISSPSAPSSSSSSSLGRDEQAEISRIVQDLEDVKKDWERIRALLADAAEKQIQDRSVQQWLNEVKDLAYEMEHLRDVYEYEVVAREVEDSKKALSSSGDAGTSKRRKLEVRLSMVTSLSPLLDASFRDQIARNVKGIKKTFKSIARRRRDLKLKRSDGRQYSSGVTKRQPTGHLPTDPVFLGRDLEMSQLCEMLLADHGDGQMKVEVIALIGMGGAGKTTLAQHVSNCPEVKENFEKIGWVHVSEKFDVARLITAVIESFSGKSCDLKEVSSLQDKAAELIKDKKVLIVMDDIWNTESWESSVAPFNHVAKGSKILVTTRLPEVADRLKAVKSIKLSELSGVEGWSLLRKHASPNQTDDGDNLEELEEIGKKIVSKCGGLPLSIKLLGSLLRSKGNDEDEWRKVSESNLLEHGIKENEQILGSLYLSYLYLPPQLKSCFKHCAIYPNRKLDAKHLKYSWMAHDLVNDMKEAAKCLKELESRYFLFFDFRGNINTHDHIYDLAQFVLGEKHRDFILDGTLPNLQTGPDILCSRYVSLILQNIESVDIDIEASKVRILHISGQSVAAVTMHMYPTQCLQELTIYNRHSMPLTITCGSQNHFKSLRMLTLHTDQPIPLWVSQLYNLRYLSVQGSEFKCLPNSVCDFKNLKWLQLENSGIEYLPDAVSGLTNLQELNLHESKITYLPKTISELVNLQELNLYKCEGLRELPEGITTLTNLQILNLMFTPISFVPKGFGALTKLEYLTDYIVNSTHAGLTELKNMNRLNDIFLIKNLCEVVSEKDAAQAEMASKKQLHVLLLCWSNFAYIDHFLQIDDFLCFPFYSNYHYYNRFPLRDVLTHGRCERIERGNEERIAHHEEGIFEQLRPHRNIERLFVSDYRGYKLPCWMGNKSFTKLGVLYLYEVDYCTSLSPMDQLPSLEWLILECMDSLVELVPELSVGRAGFMHPGHPAAEQGQPFPKLKELMIYDCKSLESLLLDSLTSLESVSLDKCSNLNVMSIKASLYYEDAYSENEEDLMENSADEDSYGEND